MMLNKNWIVALLFLSLFFSLSHTLSAQSKIEFVKIKDIKIDRFTLSDIDLTGKVVIYNHLRVAAKVKDIQVDVYLDDIHIGTVHESYVEKIRKRQATDLRLEVNAHLKKNFANLFNNTGNIILGKTIKLEYKGKLTVRVFGIIKKEIKFQDDLFFKLNELM
jgi:LEA14-like dessication related protein